MSVLTPVAAPVRRPSVPHPAHPLASVRFDALVAAASGWFVGGLYLDGWAHNTLASLETFFTPWHAVLYSGFFVALAVLGWGIGRNRGGGRTAWTAIPAGYELSLIGAALFIVGGVGDMFWHIAFGIEADVEALLSPTHLLLLLGGSLFIAGPLRSAARRRAAGLTPLAAAAHLPRLLSLTYVLLGIAFFTQFANLWADPWLASAFRPVTGAIATAGGRALPAPEVLQALNIAGVLVQSVLLAGGVLVALRGGRVPMGGFTLVIGLYVALTVLMRQKYDGGMQAGLILAGVAAGAVADFAVSRLRPSLAAPTRLRIFLGLVPATVTAANVLAIALAQGTWWSIHLWAGAIVVAGAAGWLLGLLATPPPVYSSSGLVNASISPESSTTWART